VEDTGALEAVLKRVRGHLTVLRSVTMIALSAIKEGGALDVGLPAAEMGLTPRPAAANGHAARPARAGRK